MGSGFSTYSIIIGHLGSDAVAANSFVIVVRNFGTILCFGIASAGGILLGKVIGENRLEDAREDAKKLMKLTVISGALGRSSDPGSYALCTEIRLAFRNSHALSEVHAAHQHLLRHGRSRQHHPDSRCFPRRRGQPVRIRLRYYRHVVLCGSPLGFIAAFVFKLPVMWVYFLLCTDEFVKWPWVFKHYRSEKWLNNITRDNLFEEKITQE